MKVNDSVAWTWGTGLAEGVIKSVHHERTEIESKGKKIVRNGTKDNPALIIEHISGTTVLKLQSEVQNTSD
jgi:Hypervirulence associated proteins TUDOR domain